MAYCEWLTGKLNAEGKDGIITLPTEAQWEKAARGDDGRIYPWGDDKIAPNRANYIETGINDTSPVGCFPGGKSPYELFDMSGNVFEWCLDDRREYRKESVTNPYQKGAVRVLRGGSFGNRADICRSAARLGHDPDDRYDYVGFRLALLPGQRGEPGRSGK